MRKGVPAALAAVTLALSGCKAQEEQGSRGPQDEERHHSDVAAERMGRDPGTQPFEGEPREGYEPPPEALPGTGGAGGEEMRQDAGTGGAGAYQYQPQMGADAGTGGAGFEQQQMGADAGTGGAGFEQPQMGADAGTGGAGPEQEPTPQEQPSNSEDF